MPRRPANITQADIARTLRAFREANLPNMRVRITGSEIIVEPADQTREPHEPANDVADGDELAIL